MKYKISQNSAFSELDGEICIFHSPSSEYLIINKVGSYIWKLLENQISKEDILKNLLNKFDVDEKTCTVELNQFIDKGTELGIIEEMSINA